MGKGVIFGLVQWERAILLDRSIHTSSKNREEKEKLLRQEAPILEAEKMGTAGSIVRVATACCEAESIPSPRQGMDDTSVGSNAPTAGMKQIN